MNKLRVFIFVLLFFWFSHAAFAQSADTLQDFADIQRALAGDPSEWMFRETTEGTKFFYPAPITPQQVLATEDRARLGPSLDTDPDENGMKDIEFAKAYFDEESGKGAFWRGLAGGTQFAGEYKLTSGKETELEIIKDIYEQITSRVVRFGVPSDDSPAACLKENVGMCRHMATILQESLEEYGIKSEQIFSPTHTWVRITLSDPLYKDNLFAQFDLDPTWYAQPIPLPPRNGIFISDAWKKAMLAVVPSGTPTPTPSVSVTPTLTLTPTPTFTPTPTPTISEDQDDAVYDDDTTGTSGPSDYEGCKNCGPWTESR